MQPSLAHGTFHSLTRSTNVSTYITSAATTTWIATSTAPTKTPTTTSTTTAATTISYYYYLLIPEDPEGSLEVKLPTIIWTDGKAEVGRVREEKSRREKKREEIYAVQVREKVGKSRNCVFPIICSSRGSKSIKGCLILGSKASP